MLFVIRKACPEIRCPFKGSTIHVRYIHTMCDKSVFAGCQTHVYCENFSYGSAFNYKCGITEVSKRKTFILEEYNILAIRDVDFGHFHWCLRGQLDALEKHTTSSSINGEPLSDVQRRWFRRWASLNISFNFPSFMHILWLLIFRNLPQIWREIFGDIKIRILRSRRSLNAGAKTFVARYT